MGKQSRSRRARLGIKPRPALTPVATRAAAARPRRTPSRATARRAPRASETTREFLPRASTRERDATRVGRDRERAREAIGDSNAMSPPGSSARHSPAASGASAERWLQKAFGEASVNVVDRASARREEVRWTSRARARTGRGRRGISKRFLNGRIQRIRADGRGDARSETRAGDSRTENETDE